MLLGYLVGLPDGRKTGRLGCHNVYSVTEVDRKILNSGTYKFKHLVFNKAILEGRSDESYCNVVRAYASLWSTRKIYENYLGRFYVIGVLQKLFYKLRSAFTNAHSSERAVASVRV